LYLDLGGPILLKRDYRLINIKILNYPYKFGGGECTGPLLKYELMRRLKA
jgi:hypothetical protein